MQARHLLLPACLLSMTLSASQFSRAQDSAFLACARYSDRGLRIACLEDALETALQAEANDNPAEVAPAAEAAVAADALAKQAPAPDTPSAVTPATGPSASERLESFGQSETRITTDDDGNDQLTDTIASLEKRNNLWIVTLASGQVWRQQVPRTMNLRNGDEITIYQAGIGNGYRLSATRLSGFIRVERVR